MHELDDKNLADVKAKEKICAFCRTPQKVKITRTALNDIGLLGLTKNGVLELIVEHIESKRRMFTDRMDNGDTAYIIEKCAFQDDLLLYVKVKFVKEEIVGEHGMERLNRQTEELMVLISSHPPRRW